MKSLSEAAPERTKQLEKILRQYWGFTSFRPDQQTAVAAIDNGRDTVVVLPTGGGKSLCYQLPSLTRGRVLVISPLISLMQDQVTALHQLGLEAAFLNSTVSTEDSREIYRKWCRNDLRLLYVAPERLLSEWFLDFLSNNEPAFFAIDEAHCISQWGHDFRPEYRQLKLLRNRFSDVPICALTATATSTVRKDIVAQAGLSDPVVVVGDFYRPNLHYRLEQRTNRRAQIEEILLAHKGSGGIIYCISRKDTESLSEYLGKRGFNVAAYHAGLERDVRRQVQEDFTSERLDAVIATVAFGMGIDRSNVRFVIHSAMPASIEAYQQETGRAGRDGLPAECVLLYSYSDTQKWRTIFENSENSDDAMDAVRLERLREMEQFSSSRTCRHKFLVQYFGQEWKHEKCGNCDNCTDPTATEVHPHSVVLAQKILSCVIRLNERYGIAYVIKVLRGDTASVQPVHCGLSTFGLLSDVPVAQLRRWIDECLQQDLLLRAGDQYPVLNVTVEGWKVLRGQGNAELSPPPKKAARPSRSSRIEKHMSTTALDLSDQEQDLFQRLRAMRAELAKSRNVPAFMIMHDSVLVTLASRQPASHDELHDISGLGVRKRADFGDDIIRVISRWRGGDK